MEGLDRCTIVSCVDFRPEGFSTEVQAWLVGIDPLSANLLTLTLFSAENARHLVAVGVVARVVVPPLLLILAVLIAVLWSEILTALLTLILRVLGKELLLAVLRDSLDIVFFFFLLDSLDPGCASCLVF